MGESVHELKAERIKTLQVLVRVLGEPKLLVSCLTPSSSRGDAEQHIIEAFAVSERDAAMVLDQDLWSLTAAHHAILTAELDHLLTS
jgi:DNA gyrase/topoisomerase IV subunit A